ncbi:MAG: ROK family transcriptional regulator [Christensenellaceae bacterium]
MYQFIAEKNKKKTGFSQQQTKRNNTALLFNLVRANAPISRINLAEKTGLSATTVSLLIEELIENRLIKETGTADTNMRGRKPIMLEVNGDGGYFIVLELMNRGFICSLYDLSANRISLLKIKIDEIKKKNITVNDAIYKMLKDNKISKKKLIGVNISYPGIVDGINNKLISSTVLEISEIITNEDIVKLIQDNPNVHLLINNTSVVVAYAEYMLNSNFVNCTIIGMTMYEGIGAGVIIVGSKGECTHSYDMEIGHMVIERGGKKCKCGNRGCLEAICSAPAIFERINKETSLDIEYGEEWGSEINEQAVEIIKKEMELGNEKVMTIVDDFMAMLITAIVNTINMISAQHVFISGVLINMLGNECIERINEQVNSLHVMKSKEKCEVQISKLDYELIRKGAVYMIMDSVFAISSEGDN